MSRCVLSAVRSGCFMLFAAAFASAQGGEGQSPLEPIPFPTSHVIVSNTTGGPFGTIFATTSDATDPLSNPEAVAVDSVPFGPGLVTPTTGGWHIAFADGEAATVTMVDSWGVLAIDFVVSGVSGYLVDGEGSFTPLGPQGPGGQGGLGGAPDKKGGIDLWATWPAPLAPWIQNADFVQFMRCTILLVRLPPGGQPYREPMPAGTKINITSNGGAYATSAQRSAGAGEILVDGSTIYVDSGNPSTPYYIGGGARGHITDTSAQMHDAPNIGYGTVGQICLGLPNFTDIIGFDALFEFWCYFTVDGQVVGSYSYVCIQRTRWVGQLGPLFPPVTQGGCTTPLSGPANGFTSDHQQCLDGFNGGNFGGLTL